MSNLWTMFFAMQLLCFMDIYDVPTPANVVIFIGQFKNMITFKMLNPQGIINIWDPEFDMGVLIKKMTGGTVKRVVTSPD